MLPPKYFLLTGVTSGIGLVLIERIIREFQKQNHLFICIACRNMIKGENLRKSLEFKYPDAEISLVKMDVGSVQSVLVACQKIKLLYPKLDCVYLNAGMMPVKEFDWKYIFKTTFLEFDAIEMLRTGYGMFKTEHYVTNEGVNNIFATNVLGHYVLVCQLVGMLSHGDDSSDCSQIIWTTSTNANEKAYDPKDITCNYGSQPYSCSKYVMEAVSIELNKHLNKKGIFSHIADPGTVVTNITGSLLPFWVWYLALPLLYLVRFCIPQLTLTPYNACESLIWLLRQDPRQLDPQTRYCSFSSVTNDNYIVKQTMNIPDSESIYNKLTVLSENITAMLWDKHKHREPNLY